MSHRLHLLCTTAPIALLAHERFRAFLGSMVVAANLAAARALGGRVDAAEVEALSRAVEVSDEAECHAALARLAPIPLSVYGRGVVVHAC